MDYGYSEINSGSAPKRSARYQEQYFTSDYGAGQITSFARYLGFEFLLNKYKCEIHLNFIHLGLI